MEGSENRFKRNPGHKIVAKLLFHTLWRRGTRVVCGSNLTVACSVLCRFDQEDRQRRVDLFRVSRRQRIELDDRIGPGQDVENRGLAATSRDNRIDQLTSAEEDEPLPLVVTDIHLDIGL